MYTQYNANYIESVHYYLIISQTKDTKNIILVDSSNCLFLNHMSWVLFHVLLHIYHMIGKWIILKLSSTVAAAVEVPIFWSLTDISVYFYPKLRSVYWKIKKKHYVKYCVENDRNSKILKFYTRAKLKSILLYLIIS